MLTYGNSKKVPYEKEFREFEKDFKNQLAQDFDETAGDSAKFNAAMQKELLQHEVDIINCRMKILGNIETEATNLHSFSSMIWKKQKNRNG